MTLSKKVYVKSAENFLHYMTKIKPQISPTLEEYYLKLHIDLFLPVRKLVIASSCAVINHYLHEVVFFIFFSSLACLYYLELYSISH